MPTCQNCQQSFPITDFEQAFHEKMNVPSPRLCPDCRSQRRQAHLNEIHLFSRKCDATGENIISNFPSDSPVPVYAQKYWYSDQHDGTKYGREFDFNRSFFEQFYELSKVTPRPALFSDFLHDENSAYTNYAGKNKNCYMIFDSDENRDCLYSYGLNGSKDCSDCYRAQKLELCYEVMDSKNCYNCAFVYNSETCNDCVFLNNCFSCKNCLFCSNLRHKEYCVENKPVSPEIYQSLRKSLGSFIELQKKKSEFADFRKKWPQKFMQGTHNEEVTGNYLVHCKNAKNCFDSMNLRDGMYVNRVFIKANDCLDVEACGQAQLIYQCATVGYNAYNVRFSSTCLEQLTNLTYCDYCFHCQDCFGCVGLRRKRYCILNKQYTKEEYESLVPRIIEHMKKVPANRQTPLLSPPSSILRAGLNTGGTIPGPNPVLFGSTPEWGEFFPVEMSLWPYNLSMAQEYFPLTKEQALAKGYKWRDESVETQNFASLRTEKIAERIEEVNDLITQQVLVCECGRNYKITAQELKLYQKLDLPIPRHCFYCRHKKRSALRNLRRLYERNCMKCGAGLETTYSPERTESVYCEKCYLESL